MGFPKIRNTFLGGYRGIWGVYRVSGLEFPKFGSLFGGPHHKENLIFGSILGSPCSWKLPYLPLTCSNNPEYSPLCST